MTNRVSYLNSKNTFWQDTDLKNIERDFFTDGVIDFNKDTISPSAVGSDLQVFEQDTPDKTIFVKTGVAYFRVFRNNDTDSDGIPDELVLRFHNLENKILTIPDNTSGSDKTFEVCCFISKPNMNAETINATASNIGELIVQEEGGGLENKLLLATVTVENNFTEVTQDEITDHRMRVAFKAVPKGMTATISEINLALDGILASSFDLNVLENTSVTKEEFNRVLTGTLVTATELNLLHAVSGLTKSDLQKLANIDASADEIDQALDGISPEVAASNLNILVGGGFTNLHKHPADPSQSGITESPVYFYSPSKQIEFVMEKRMMTRFSYADDTETIGEEHIEVVNDDFQEYESFYKEITNFETDANTNYIGGSFDTAEYKEGTRSLKRQLSLDSTGTLLIEFSSQKDLSDFMGSDNLEFWIFVTDPTHVDMTTIQLGSTTPSVNYFQNDFLLQIHNIGWNKIKIPISSFSSVGIPNFENIVRIRFEFSTNTNGNSDFYVDSLRVIKSDNTTDNMWLNNEGEWEFHTIENFRRYVKTDEVSGDKNSLLSLGNQSRSFQNGIFTVRIRRLQGTGNTGVKWRCQNDTSYYTAYFSGTQLVLGKMNGTFTEIQAVNFVLTNNTDVWLKITFNNDQIIVATSNDGISFTDQITVTDNNIFQKGQLALFDNENITAFDKVTFKKTSKTYEKTTSGNLVRVEENTGNADKFDGFNSFFKKITSFEESSITGGFQDGINFKTGSFSWKVSTSNEVANLSDINLSLKYFEDGINSSNTDYITFWVFVANEIPNSINVVLSEVSGLKEASMSISSSFLNLGWNFFSFPKSAFTVTGGFDWSKVTAFSFSYTHTNNNPAVSFDSVQMIKSTGVLASKYDTINGQWFIEKVSQNQYFLQSSEDNTEKLCILKSVDGNNIFSNFDLFVKFLVRRGNNAGLVFKYQDEQNFLRIEYNNQKISFIKRVSGVDEVIGEEMNINIESEFFLKVICDNNVFQYFYSLDETTWICISEVSVTDFSNGKIGFFTKATLLRIDELFIYEHNQGGDTFYEIFYDENNNVSSIIKKPII